MASKPMPFPHRLFLTDRASRVQFIIDPLADVCVYPRRSIHGQRDKSDYSLSAANGTTIITYETITLSLDFGLRRIFSWRFVVADVSKPIIGADFLSYYDLLVDIRLTAAW